MDNQWNLNKNQASHSQGANSEKKVEIFENKN
jgi:hypothetical protein